jgi:hypothetical protein
MYIVVTLGGDEYERERERETTPKKKREEEGIGGPRSGPLML